MSSLRLIALLAALLLPSALFVGCGKKDGDGHDHAKEEAHGKDDGHGHGEESPSGASFKAGKGVIVTDETKKLLGVEVSDVTDRKLPNQIRLTVQVFGEKHHHLLNPEDHTGCDVHGSGFVSTNTAAVLKAGQPVALLKSTNAPLGGVVLAVQKALALGESEIVIGVSNATAALKPGEFIPARINLPIGVAPHRRRHVRLCRQRRRLLPHRGQDRLGSRWLGGNHRRSAGRRPGRNHTGPNPLAHRTPRDQGRRALALISRLYA
jgi:hypothetical protein